MAVHQGTPPRLFDLVERLIGEVAGLLDQKLALLALEVRNQGAAAVRSVVGLLAAATVVGVGMLLMAIALSVWIGTQIHSMPGGYAIVGAAFALVGTIAIVTLRGRLRPKDLAPTQTVEELRRDARWITDKR